MFASGISPLRSGLSGLVAAALLLAAIPFLPGVGSPVAANGTIGLTISPGATVTVGTTMTISTTGTYVVPAGGSCMWHVTLHQRPPKEPELPQQVLSDAFGTGNVVGGKCQAIEVRLPNPTSMVATLPGQPTEAWWQLAVYATDGSIVAETPNIRFSIPASAATPTFTSSIPFVLWQLTPPYAPAGQLMTLTPRLAGFPAGYPREGTDDSFSAVARPRQAGGGYAANRNSVSPTAVISFSQVAHGTIVWLDAVIDGRGTVASTWANAIDPPAGDETDVSSADEIAAIPNTAIAPRQGAEFAASAAMVAWSDTHIDNAIGGSVFAAGLGLVMLLLMGWARGHRQERFGPEPKRGLLTRIFRREQRTIDPFSRKLKN